MKLFVFICLISFALGGFAQTSSGSSVAMRFRIFYPVGVVELHEDYMDNANALHRIRKYLEKSPKIDSITIYSYASPEGPYRLNKRLAAGRGKTVKEYLLKHLPPHRQLPDSLLIIDPTAENWEGLRRLVQYQYTLDDKDKVLDILSRTDISDERRKVLLKGLNRGKSWKYILKHLMPQLRYATWVMVWQPLEIDLPMDTIIRPKMDFPIKPLPKLAPLPEFKEERLDTALTFAVKSNLLYDAVTALNVEVEVPIKNHWSVMVEDVFPWWETGNKYCLQLWEMGVEGRYWFSNNQYHSKKLQGHFAGAYAMSGKYDFQWDHDLCYQGTFWSAGATYGYAKKISRLFQLEFSVSLGYMSTEFQHYQPSIDYEQLYGDLEGKRRISYWGPTKLKVSLVMPIHLKWRRKK